MKDRKVPDKIVNKELYKSIRDIYFKINKVNSAYRSLQLIKLYKKFGGKINEEKEKKSGLNRWLKEKWIEVIPYLINGDIIECGNKKSPYIACRPLKRINKNTPITINELIQKHGKEKVLIFSLMKEINKNKRANWKILKII